MFIILAVISLAVLTIYWWGFVGRLYIYTFRDHGPLSQHPPVSLIIAVKDELVQLPGLFTALEKLSYPKLEIVFVDDGSADGSTEVMERWAVQRSYTKVVRMTELQKGPRGKKPAILAGIKAASHDILLFTDADGRPATPQWVELMVAPYVQEGADVVLGAGPMRGGNRFAEWFSAYDTLFIALQYGAFALWGIPYMGVGRNLLYHRSWFDKTDAFASHMDLLSGDDDLPIDRFGKEGKVRLQFLPGAAVYSRPPKDITAWFKQKARHLSTSLRYRPVTRLLLMAFELAGVTFFISLFMSVCTGATTSGVLFFVLYLLISWPICGLTAKRIGMEVPIILMPLMVWVRPVLYIIAWTKVNRQKHEW